LIDLNEFDTIYHEHFSYFSLLSTIRIMDGHNLRVFDVDELKSHGGSLRIYACRAESKAHTLGQNVEKVLADERRAALDRVEGYRRFASKVQETKFALLEFLIKAKREGKTVAGYGAPGKSATLLHYCGIGKDLIEYTVDRNPYKQGRYLPGTHVPICRPERIRETKPDYVLILPWNLKDEIMQQLTFVREWGGRFIVPIPMTTIF